MVRDPETLAHQEWLGYVQPVGLVVSPPALGAAQAVLSRNVVGLQQALSALVQRDAAVADGAAILTDLPAFAAQVLGFEPGDLVEAAALPADLEVVLPDEGETLRPSFAVPGTPRAAKPAERWRLLVLVLPPETALDDPGPAPGTGWHASPQLKFERLLRETGVPIGLVSNGLALRLVYAPRGESSGHLTFPVQAMTEVAGRPILAALHLLLSAERLFTLPQARQLPALLEQSRKYQNEVSTELSEQVLRALNELLRGFQAADAAQSGGLLAVARRDDPQHIYGGLLTTLMRLVFLLYAEERGLLPSDPTYVAHYGATGLYERLRRDADRHPDTMDQRFGAYAQLISLFRLVHDGGAHGALVLPARRGQLFDPDRYPFLEGRPYGVARVLGAPLEVPRVPDGVVLRVLEDLLWLGGERLSYRALDVEQVGSVYEAMMGFELEVATGPSIAVRPDHVVVDLGQVLARPAPERAKFLEAQTGCKLSGAALGAFSGAATVEALVAALERRVSPRTPRLLPEGSLYLQPSAERRRSGSHYTPRALTEPIVRTTLQPVLKALGPRPRPEQLLDLKVCDPAMGSGAFLVEACRQLSEALVAAWQHHGGPPPIPPDEDPLLHARRLVAERCLYGVDKNPFAVGLAKLSLWLVTLAKDHPFTFVDHALCHGDSLVGLCREQLARFHWDAQAGDALPLFTALAAGIEAARGHRQGIAALGDAGERAKVDHWDAAEKALDDARLTGDLLVAAFFAADKAKARDERRKDYRRKLDDWRAGLLDRVEVEALVAPLRAGPRPVPPFHWDIEFPEVFSRPNGGFDAVVGNPPFAGKNTLAASTAAGTLDWLLTVHPESHGNSDLVAHFFRRAFDRLREGGCLGLVATNTIAQGDTRQTGLRWLATHGGTLYDATKRLKWPGQAAVVVSVVHVAKGPHAGPFRLDGREVERITAFLFHRGGHEPPARLAANAGKSFIGSYVLGMGFTFDDTDTKGVANPIAEMHRLIAKDPRNAERITPFIGGEELNSSPTQSHRRYVVDFEDMSEAEARRWPDLFSIVEAKVKPQRMIDNRDSYRRYWWQFAEKRGELTRAIAGYKRVMVLSSISKHLALAFAPARQVFSHNTVVFLFDRPACLSLLQCRAHEIWVRLSSSTLEDRLGYRPTDCFETFPFPEGWETNAVLEAAGKTYYEFRAALMIRNNEGLTATYNRFHDPDERDPDIGRLRELHAAMDRAVLDAYGFTDVPTACEFLLDYEEPEADDEAGRSRRRKKPWRYRWPDAVRDDVLARLLDLNRQRAAAERLSGAAAEKAAPRPQKKPRKPKPNQSGELF